MGKIAYVKSLNKKNLHKGITWHICGASGVPKCPAGKKSYYAGHLSEITWAEVPPGTVCTRCKFSGKR